MCVIRPFESSVRPSERWRRWRIYLSNALQIQEIDAKQPSVTSVFASISNALLGPSPLLSASVSLCGRCSLSTTERRFTALLVSAYAFQYSRSSQSRSISVAHPSPSHFAHTHARTSNSIRANDRANHEKYENLYKITSC